MYIFFKLFPNFIFIFNFKHKASVLGDGNKTQLNANTGEFVEDADFIAVEKTNTKVIDQMSSLQAKNALKKVCQEKV